MNDRLTLYSAKVCPFAQRTLILCKEKNLEYDLIEIDLDNKPKSFTDLTPTGTVPLISHKGAAIYESSVINEYLDQIFPTPPLFSSDPVEKAFMKILISYCDNRLIPAFYKLLLGQDADKRDQLREPLKNVLQFIEEEGFNKHGNSGDYFFGKTLSMVDITFYPFFERFVVLAHYRDMPIPASCVRLKHWFETMQTLDSVKQTANPNAFYIDKYKHYADGSTQREGAKRLMDN